MLWVGVGGWKVHGQDGWGVWEDGVRLGLSPVTPKLGLN
jgi:hypothetical protein